MKVSPCQADNVVQLRLDEDALIENALEIIERRMKKVGISLSSPTAVKNFLTLHLAQMDHEVFAALWLDSKHRLIAYEEMFSGTLTQTSVYPREVVRAAMRHNAASVIFSHNHPSGEKTPSAADCALTANLKQTLALVDVRVLDHVIVAGTQTYSFAEHGHI